MLKYIFNFISIYKMYETHKYSSILYKPPKPFYKMTIKELCDHNKICKSLDKTPLKKIVRMEKWDKEKLNRKKKKFLNKSSNKTKRILYRITRKERKNKNRKTKSIQKKKHRTTKKEILF